MSKSLTLFLCLIFCFLFFDFAKAKSLEGSDLNYVFEEGAHGYEVYRIPAIVKAKSGKLLAFAEARKFKRNGDSGDIDLVLKTSDDHGKTWSPMRVIWDDGVNTCGNPVPIVDEKTGRIHLLLSWNHGDDRWGALIAGEGKDVRRAFYTWSDDEGESWKDPEEITNDIKDASWDWYGTGPVHGIQLKKGPYKGRLISPNYFTVMKNGKRVDYSHVAFSDDQGEAWLAGAPTQLDDVGECTVAELADGRLILNMRASSGTFRKFCISEDGGETWGDLQTDRSLLDPSCQGSLYSDLWKGRDVLLFANAANVERRDMTVKSSFDDGLSWSKEILIHEGPSAYSDLTMTNRGQIALLFEGGKGRPYEGIAIELIDIENFK